MRVTLELQATDEAQRPKRACWFPAHWPEPWYAALARSAVDHESVACRVGDDVLIAATNDGEAAALEGGIACGCIAERLFLPTHARVVPPATDEQLAEILPDDGACYLWRPHGGVVRLAAASRSSEWVRVAVNRADEWNAAQQGEAAMPRLTSIRSAVAPALEDWLLGARDDIGQDAAQTLRKLTAETQDSSRTRLWPQVRRWLPLLPIVLFALLGWFAASLASRLEELWELLRDWFPWSLLVPFVVLAAVALLAYAIRRARRKASSWSHGDGASDGSGEALERSLAHAPAGGRGENDFATRAAALWGHVADWWRRQRLRVDEQLEEARERELARLIQLLDRNPDEGLRYALPIGGGGLPRGRATPGSQLLRNQTDFSLQSLHGGGAADAWRVSYESQQRLVARYRDLAQRERQLGRHRRAAYIQAHLLGDFAAAAQTLSEGRCFREAAVLYEQKLDNVSEAAECYVRGGLFAEALERFVKLRDWRRAAELHERLGDVEPAREAYRKWLEQLAAAHDYLGAAKVCEEKLNEPEEALNILLRGWRESDQGDAFLPAAFALLARRGRHEQSHALLNQVVEELREPRVPHGCKAAAALSRVAREYPEAALRRQAADATRRAAAAVLNAKSAPTDAVREQLLLAVQETAGDDRLLSRDCERYAKSVAERPRKTESNRSKIHCVASFQLPRDVRWTSALNLCNALYAAGYRGDEVRIMRCLWDGTRRQFPAGPAWNVRVRDNDDLLLVGHRLDQGRVYIHPRGGLMLPAAQVFARDDQMRARVVSGFADFAPHVHALWVDESEHLMIVVQQNESLGIQQFAATGRLAHSARFTIVVPPADGDERAAGPDVAEAPVAGDLESWITTANGWCSHMGRSLLEFSREGDGWLVIAELPRPIVRLATSRHTRAERCAASLERGVRIWFGDVANGEAVTFAEHLRAPWTAFLGDGRVVAADEQCIELFAAATARSFRHLASLPLLGGRPIALAPLARNDQAGLVTDRGEVLVLQFSSS
ncbi:MAG: hypothetical protein U0939_18870 [Pirellulales bacterium]